IFITHFFTEYEILIYLLQI
ncbi:hypothetical protein HEM43_011530, partial [Escherichia coli]|nr:hypothetical protein [Escherichia coli]